MINLILIFPIVACLILFILKKQKLNNIMIVLYAIIHLTISIAAILANKELLPFWQNIKFFALNELNSIFLLVLSVIYFAVAIYNIGYMKDEVSDSRKLRHYSYMVLFFVFSMTGAILSNNLGITWVFIEATTLASAYLIYFHKTKHSIEAAWKYVFICSIGIALAFVGIILLTVSTGNLNSLFYQDLYNNASEFNAFWLKIAFVFILFGIGTKMGLAPVHFWLPDAHAQSPSPISALLSATLLNSAFLMILNVFKIMIIAKCDGYARIMLMVMGFLSLFVAAVFLYHINNYKRMLAYSSIENMGILAIGAALGGAGMFAAIIHLIGHSFIKASLFMTSGNILKLYKTKKIKSINGILEDNKLTGWLWIVSFIGIAAFPPSILFISEFIIVKTMISNNRYILAILFLMFLTIILYGLGKSIISMTFGKSNKETKIIKLPLEMYVPQIVLLFFALFMGLYMPKNFIAMIVSSSVGF